MAQPDDTLPRDDASAAAVADAVIKALQAENAVLRSENAALIGRLAELERRLGLNSSNSGKPPSSGDCRKIGGRNSFRYFDALGGPSIQV